MNFVDRVLELINEKRISKNKLLTDLNLSKNSFVNWIERGTIPGGDVLAKIAEYFDVSVDYLLGLSETRHRVVNFSDIDSVVADYDDEKFSTEFKIKDNKDLYKIKKLTNELKDLEIEYEINQVPTYGSDKTVQNDYEYDLLKELCGKETVIYNRDGRVVKTKLNEEQIKYLEKFIESLSGENHDHL